MRSIVEHQSKNIVICCDGTSNQYGKNNTNVVFTFDGVLKSRSRQMAFYDPGVGTFSLGKHITFLGNTINEILGAAFGTGLQKNVEDAYGFLMENYCQGDKVFIFGFSRGAHTARRLAYMLDKCGLLMEGNKNLIPYASKVYLKRKNESIAGGFKEIFAQRCDVHFVGVWDTVSALPFCWRSPNHKGILSSTTLNFFHAISIDEKRRMFPVDLIDEEKVDRKRQRVEQVWFRGFHSDVGGYFKERGVSNIALKWMLENAAECGLLIKEGYLESIKTNPKDKVHQSFTFLWWFIPWHPVLLIFFGLSCCISVAFFDFSLWGYTAKNLVTIFPVIIVGMVLLIFANIKKRIKPLPENIHQSFRDE